MKRTGIVLLLVLIACFSACVKTQNYDSEDDFQVSSLDGGKSVEITEYIGNKHIVNIPPRIGGIPVTDIGERAFMEKGLIKVTIPNSVTTIGHWAFTNNQLTSVTIPNSVTTIGQMAFARNPLISVTVPGIKTSIGNSAFPNTARITYSY